MCAATKKKEEEDENPKNSVLESLDEGVKGGGVFWGKGHGSGESIDKLRLGAGAA